MTFRVDADEKAAIEALAERAGLTPGSYIRSRALKRGTTRAVRRPPVETAQLARLLGVLGVVGGAIARLAKKRSAETGTASEEPQLTEPPPAEPLTSELLAAVSDFRRAAEAIIHTMGKHPHLLHSTHRGAGRLDAGHRDH